MEISGANAIITHVVEKEQCTVKRILSHRQHTDGSGAPTRGYDTGRSSYTAIGTGRIGAPVQTPIGNTIHVATARIHGIRANTWDPYSVRLQDSQYSATVLVLPST